MALAGRVCGNSHKALLIGADRARVSFAMLLARRRREPHAADPVLPLPAFSTLEVRVLLQRALPPATDLDAPVDGVRDPIQRAPDTSRGLREVALHVGMLTSKP